eukprot:CAMPEP_0172681754 /NCGR_PEP_ID=MMETSP1074-20121228/17686_1 /TAXON_ID=2916 /ORGANISM="Ceratium fusus, Strain PA161109" /LENGTH=74 /DNA_ID=CAMNT_0013500311 /DNA_START=118 /DNA_END=339 /DNA_ORIENTATION=+
MQPNNNAQATHAAGRRCDTATQLSARTKASEASTQTNGSNSRETASCTMGSCHVAGGLSECWRSMCAKEVLRIV